MADLARIKLLAMDVDGVLTDGAIRLNADGDTYVEFSAADGLGISVAMQCGIVIVWITGRTSAAVLKRAEMLGVKHVFAGVKNKKAVLQAVMRDLNVEKADVGYIGDDWNDLPAYEAAGVRIAVANARPELRCIADFVTEASGGQGAVREIIDGILYCSGRLEEACAAYVRSICEAESDTHLAQ